MTTCNEIDRILKDPAADRTQVALHGLVDTDDPEAVESLAIDLAALANGRGGRILIGVRPDGGLADPDELEIGGLEDLLDRIRRERISPPPDFRVEHLSCSRGHVAVVNVPRQSAGPFAVRGGGAGADRSRAYAVRSPEGVEAVDDDQLRWLFRHPRDPALSQEVRVVLGYLAGSLRLPPMLPQPRCAAIYDALLAGLPEGELATVADDPEKILELWVALTPYAFAASMATVFSRTWLPEARADASTSARRSPPPSRTVSLAELPAPPGSSVLAAVAPSLDDLFGGLEETEFRIPPDAEVQVGILKHRRRARFTIQNRHFTLQLVWRLAKRGTGIPWYGENDDPAPSLAERLSWVALDAELILSLDYPGRAVETSDRYVAFAEALADHLSVAWDGRRFVATVPEPLLRELCSRPDLILGPADR